MEEFNFAGFIVELYNRISRSGGNPEYIFPLIQENIDLFHDDLLEYYQVWLSENSMVYEVTGLNEFYQNTYRFAVLIMQVPFGSIEIYMELAICACEFLLEMIGQESEQSSIFIKNMLGLAYLDRLRGDKGKNIERAIDAIGEYLKSPYFQEESPQRAASRHNLGRAYLNRIYGIKEDNLKKAITAVQQSLRVFTKEAYPRDWAKSMQLLGCILIESDREDIHNTMEAASCFQNALSVYSLYETPMEWAMAQKNLAQILLISYQFFEDGPDRLVRSVDAFEKCLKVYSRERYPMLWVEVNLKIAFAYKYQYHLTNNRDCLDLIKRHCLEVLTFKENDLNLLVIENVFHLMEYVSEQAKQEDTVQEDGENLYLIKQMLMAPTWREVQTIIERNKECLLTDNNIQYLEYLRQETEDEKSKKLLSELKEVLINCISQGIDYTFEMKIRSVCAASSERVRIQPDFDKMKIDSLMAVKLLSALVGEDDEEMRELTWQFPQYSKILTNPEALEALLRRYPDLAVYIGRSPEEYEVINEQEKLLVPVDFEYLTQLEARMLAELSDDALRVSVMEYKEALEKEALMRFPAFQAYLFYHLSDACSRMQSGDMIGHLQEAIDYAKSALGLIDEKTSPIRYGYALCLLGRLYRDLALKTENFQENADKAMYYYQQASIYLNQYDAPQGYAIIALGMGDLYYALSGSENIIKAVKCYEEAGEIYTRETHPLKYASVKCKIVHSYYKLNSVSKEDLKKAVGFMEEGLCFYTKALPLEHAEIHLCLGAVYRKLAKEEQVYDQKAQEHLEYALNYFTPENTCMKYLEALVALGDLQYQRKSWSESFQTYLRALEASEKVYRLSYMPDSRQIMINTNSYLYNKLILICWELREDSSYLCQAFVFSEAAKSRTLLEQFAGQELPVPEKLPISLVKREEEVIRQIKRLENARLYENTLGKIERISKEILKVQEELTKVWDQMEEEYPAAKEYISCRRSTALNWEELSGISGRLGEKVAIVSFYFCEEFLFTFVLKKDLDTPFSFRIPYAQIADRLDIFRTFLQAGQLQKRNYKHYYEWLSLGHALLDPLKDILEDIETVYFIPNGILHAIPLHALQFHEKYFIERYRTSCVPSMAILDKLLRKKSKSYSNNEALIMAYEPSKAPVFLNEAKMLEALLGSPAYLDKDATVECLEKNAADAALIHISSHGVFCEDVMQSYLLLAEDKRFTVKDWMRLHLKADLVTLSACQTGRNKIRWGDELMGLSRALFYAGANSVLLTLWEVDAEKTMLWMEEFYSGLVIYKEELTSVARVKAFQSATVKLLCMDENPYLWAPFTLIG